MFGDLQIFLLAYFASAIVAWFAVSLAIYFAARIVVGGKASFTHTLLLVFVGVVIVGLTSILTHSLLGSFLGSVLTFLVWLWLIKTFFQTNWFSAIGIAILAVFMFLAVIILLGFILSIFGIFIHTLI
ncbi:MAG: hypothetical protein DRO36_01475 [Candidatus Hecatellales archaeon]|nr:MAG: hypothetical protein DRO36_01475 [Candidatus Hecatellales archaeon]